MAYFDTGEKIRELRKERGLNQDQLAELGYTEIREFFAD